MNRARSRAGIFFSVFIDETPDTIQSSDRTFLTPQVHFFEYKYD